VCVFGECQYVCDAGYADTNGLRSDGCEAICVPTGRLEVLCDGVDDDCDGETDEDFTVTFCGEGFCRRLSVCFRGEERCEARTPPIATDVTCDRVDDDCDGAVDDDAFCPCYADSECDDGNPCNGVETCTIGVGCNTGTPMECDDAVSCTDDTCNPLTRLCEHTALDALCDDGNPCNGGETCDARAGCMVGTPVNCDDRIACTDDACDTRTGACSHTPIHSACQDGVFCNGAESCDTVRGCISGAAPSCSDGILCTDDVCSAATDSCQNTPIHGRCDDSQYCNGTERCEAGRGCVSGAVPACDDGIGCTADACDPTAAGGTGACRNTPPDVDGDGFPPISCLGTDCNDSNRFVYPGATETCNAVDDDCDGATDETFACVQNSSGACTVGACSGVRVCSASCSWGTCTVLSTESCNAIDDNCNGATDEGFSCVYNTTQGCTVVRPTKTCSGLQTCAGPSCTWTGCVVPETGGYIETCNGIDDDCDTTVDDAPTPPNVLCTARPNATVNCASASCVLSCNSGWYDTNGVVTDGCECAIESPEASSTCGTASRDLGTFYDSGTDVTVSGKIHVAGDVDCYRFVANDSADTTCDAFNVDIRFTANPSSQFEFSVYRGACSTQVCASTIDGYSWYTDFRSGSGTSALGECGCRTTSTYLYNRCTDNGATFYFCVSRRSSYAVSCETYTIRVTNGVY
jgi:hypothetical protein